MHRLFAILLLGLLCLPGRAAAQTGPARDIASFAEVSQGQYQVLAQGGLELADQIHGFISQMLKQYSRYFAIRETAGSATEDAQQPDAVLRGGFKQRRGGDDSD